MRKIMSLFVCVSILSVSILPLLGNNVSAGSITVKAQNYIVGSSTVEWNFNSEGWNSFTANSASSEPYSPPTTPIVYSTTTGGSFVGDGINFQTLNFRFTDPNTGTWAQYYDGHHDGGSEWYSYRQLSAKWGTFDYVIYVSVPYAPTSPQPSNGATGQSTSTTINWISEHENPSYSGAIEPEPNGADSLNLYYDIFFGTTNPPPYVAYTSYVSGVNTYNPGVLVDGQTYYWKIISYGGSMGGSTGKASPVWSFSVGGDVTSPTISSTSPGDLATGVSTATGTYLIDFSEPMDTSITAISTNLPTPSASWPDSNTMQITYGSLTFSTIYYVDFTGQGHRDIATNPLSGDIYKEFTTQASGGGPDTTPPAAITNLATTAPTDNSITLTWTATGDDGSSGAASSYEVKYLALGAITEGNWASATTFSQSWTPLSSGGAESHVITGLVSNIQYWFAIKVKDEVPNISPISNSPSGTTTTSLPPQPEITQVTSYYENFYLEDLEMSNTFYVDIQSQASITKVDFTLAGESTISDSSSTNGWSAVLYMGGVEKGDVLTVTAYTVASSDSFTYNLNIVETPTWFDLWEAISEVTFHQTTNYQINNEWIVTFDFKIPQNPIDVSFNVPEYIPVFGGEYALYFYFVHEVVIDSNTNIELSGRGQFKFTAMDRSGDFDISFSGNWDIIGGEISWEELTISITGDVQFPVLICEVTFELTDGVTLVSADLEISLTPQADLTFVLGPSMSGFQIVSGVAITSVTGRIGLGVDGFADLEVLGAHVGTVTGGGNAYIYLQPGDGWIDRFSVDAYFQVTILSRTFELSYDWESEGVGTRGSSNVTWDIIPVTGNCNAEIINYSKDYVEIAVDGMEEDINENRPPIPTGITTNVTDEGIIISWNPVEGATQYNVSLVGEGGSLTSLGIVNAPTTSFLHSTNLTNQSYRYLIQSIDSEGLSSLPNSYVNYTPPEDEIISAETPLGFDIIIFSIIGATIVYSLHLQRKNRKG